MTEDERIAATLRDLAEYGWVHVRGEAMAQRIAEVAESVGIRVRIDPLATRGWYCVDEAWDEEARRHVARGVARDDP